MVACRKPKTRSAAEGSNPSASADSTTATCCEAVFSRYKGVSRLEVKVVRQAGPRKVWIGSARPCLPSPKRRVDSSVKDAKVAALLIRTSEAFGVYPLWCSPAALHLTPGMHWHRRCPASQQGSGGESTGRAIIWRAGLKETGERRAHSSCFEAGRLEREPAMTPEPRQPEEEEGHEQEHDDLKGHNDPRCLKSGAERAFVSARISRVERVCQAVGYEG